MKRILTRIHPHPNLRVLPVRRVVKPAILLCETKVSVNGQDTFCWKIIELPLMCVCQTSERGQLGGQENDRILRWGFICASFPVQERHVSVKETKWAFQRPRWGPGRQACPRQVTGPWHNQSHVSLGAGVGAVVAATVCCVLHQACSRLHRILSRQQPCELDVKIPIV